ncbi:DUF6427 family protein [Ferruginibacter sp. HRS2-29]|uniref:DUF6427 family protein n=1 Tax=Ferruginibacter sp. HRS2-29 TaxID=2487334 RepID=UPI0020CD0395|nr:hypothetical protein [Ferruginibacter sp. HRS2-29]
MIKTFKANNPSNNFLLFVYGLALKFVIFLHPVTPKAQVSAGVLYKYLLQLLSPIGAGSPVIYSILSFLLIFIQALSFNTIVNTQRMLQRPTYLVGMSYLLITSLFGDWFGLSAPLIVNTFLIWVWSKLCFLHTDPAPKTTVFNIGLAIGVATFFYYPSIVFTLLALVGLAIARPFKLPEWLIALTGILTPFYFFGAWLFLTGKWSSYQMPQTGLMLPAFYETKWAFAAILLILVTMLIGIVFIQNNLRRQVVQTRKSWQLIYLYLVVAAAIPFFNIASSFTYWILTAVPASLIVASAFFYPEKKWIPLVIHWAMVGIVVIVSYFLP